MSLATFFTESIDVHSQSVASDAAGGIVNTYAEKVSEQPAAVHRAGSSQRVVGESLAMQTQYRIFTEYSGIVNGDIVIWNGVTIRVTGVEYRKGRFVIPDYYAVSGEEVSI